MKKYVLAILILALLTQNISAYDQYSEEELNQIDDSLRRYFCHRIMDGKECNIPDLFGYEIEGICCGGFCLEGIKECSQNPEKERWSSPAKILIKKSCTDKVDNEECDIPQDLLNYLDVRQAICCDGLCQSNIGDCRELDGEYQEYGPTDNMDVNEMIKMMETLSCKGRKEGETCNIPKQVAREFDLSGVCCSGECMFGETECTGRPDLVVTEIKLMRGSLWVDEPSDYKIVIQNIGHARVNEYFWVEFSEGDSSDQKYFYIAEKPAPGDYVEYVGSIEYKKPGRYILKATVDKHMDNARNNLVAEEDERNNVLEWDVVVGKIGEVCNRDNSCDRGAGETYESCPCDCPPPDGLTVCGNGCCEESYGETHENCPRDCMEDKGNLWVCGNNVCERDRGEDHMNCMRDCHCGNNICEKDDWGENSENCPSDCGDEDNTLIYLLIAVIVLLIFLVLVLLAYRLLGRYKSKGSGLEAPSSKDYGLELKRLQDEKKSVEEMMKLAQFKYRKRKLDEESFREIVRDQQKKLIEIEARIKEMENRVTQIEEKQKS